VRLLRFRLKLTLMGHGHIVVTPFGSMGCMPQPAEPIFAGRRSGHPLLLDPRNLSPPHAAFWFSAQATLFHKSSTSEVKVTMRSECPIECEKMSAAKPRTDS
jgi:hypothetical protein